MHLVSRSTHRTRWFGLAMVLAALAGLASYSAVTAQDQGAVDQAKGLSRAFRKAAEVAMPTVVRIQSKVNSKAVKLNNGERHGNGSNPFKGSPFEEFFKNMPNMPDDQGEFEGRTPAHSGVGSGVIIDKSGIVLTNNHVVDGADEVTVRLADGRELKATDIHTDEASDLAVLKIKGNDGETFPAATLGDSDKLEIGDWVIAIGTPFELDQTVSAGIISAKGRELNGIRRSKMLQTDAAINPGNSGGPLVDLDGQVIGINTAIATNNGSFQGIGFAIPSNQAKWVLAQLLKDGSVHRAYLGIKLGEVDQELADKFGIHRHEGVLVSEVFPNTPASEAGLQDGDVITKYDNQKLQNPRDLQELVERAPIDSKQPMEILRDGKSRTVTIVAKAMPEKYGAMERPVRHGRTEEPTRSTFHAEKLGLEVADVSDHEAEAHGYKGYTGVIVVNVDDDGVAAEKGLRTGMLIRKVGKTEVHDIKQFEAALKSESLKDGVLLQVRTDAGNDFVVLKTS